ncbi:hypothetical protein [Bradyrhizobium sp. BR13661]|jgi:hypothetical protein|uniref:hypothetical protein n=1 Tax=Bradyrhizobium sp. BR13661 TaxID=2940622 RepID=UPI0024762C18|nr:hypothetical protein [Bradyrhizobium sp. BR13661]MDH6264086.1 hypothetical protein [Bradyrhizobium sp. BR13661]
MISEFMSPEEIAGLIKDQASLSLGPWPQDLKLMIFVTRQEWRCGLSPATQFSNAVYRKGARQIARELQKTIGVKQSN